MSDLYNKDLFEKFEQRKKAPKKSQGSNLKMYALIAFLALVFVAALAWRYLNDPEKKILNLNKASAAELQYIPGVGPAMAKDIIKGRPFESVEDLKKVKGIGPKTYEKIAPRVTVE